MKDGESPDAGDLLFQHAYSDALRVCDAQIRADPLCAPAYANRAIALVCLGRLDEAITGFERARRQVMKERRRRKDPDSGETSYAEDLAMVHWLKGHCREAEAELLRLIRGLTSGGVRYSDNAGGAAPGALLWFMAVRLGNAESMQEAERFLRKLSRRSRVKYWPGPLVSYLLGESSFEDLVCAAAETSDLVLAKGALTDVLTRRQVCQALFYHAAAKLDAGDFRGYFAGMRECCALENPILEVEWYIARHEAQRAVETEN